MAPGPITNLYSVNILCRNSAHPLFRQTGLSVLVILYIVLSCAHRVEYIDILDSDQNNNIQLALLFSKCNIVKKKDKKKYFKTLSVSDSWSSECILKADTFIQILNKNIRKNNCQSCGKNMSNASIIYILTTYLQKLVLRENVCDPYNFQSQVCTSNK